MTCRTPRYDVLAAQADKERLRDILPPFKNVTHAVRWYYRYGLQLRAAKTQGLRDEDVQLGCRVQGGVGSQVENILLISAWVAKCLPAPEHIGGAADCAKDRALSREVQRWLIFKAMMRDNASLARAAEIVQAALEIPCSEEWTKRLFREAMKMARTALQRRRLIP